MLQDMCGGDEKCMLEAWRLCKERAECVQHVYMEHMADRNAAKGTQQHTNERQATPSNARPGAAAAAAAAIRPQVCAFSLRCALPTRFPFPFSPCTYGLFGVFYELSQGVENEATGVYCSEAHSGAAAAAIDRQHRALLPAAPLDYGFKKHNLTEERNKKHYTVSAAAADPAE